MQNTYVILVQEHLFWELTSSGSQVLKSLLQIQKKKEFKKNSKHVKNVKKTPNLLDSSQIALELKKEINHVICKFEILGKFCHL